MSAPLPFSKPDAFVLTADDPHAPQLIMDWARQRCLDMANELRPITEIDAVVAAIKCADAMKLWKEQQEATATAVKIERDMTVNASFREGTDIQDEAERASAMLIVNGTLYGGAPDPSCARCDGKGYIHGEDIPAYYCPICNHASFRKTRATATPQGADQLRDTMRPEPAPQPLRGPHYNYRYASEYPVKDEQPSPDHPESLAVAATAKAINGRLRSRQAMSHDRAVIDALKECIFDLEHTYIFGVEI